MKRQTIVLVSLFLALAFCGARCGSCAEVIRPFNGKDLTGWKTAGGKAEETLKVGTAKVDPADPGALVVESGGADLVNPKSHARDFFCEAQFGDAKIEVEFMVPKGSNSGVYLMGEYEIQVLDSFGHKEIGPGDLGGVYGAQAPLCNASKAPGEWQKFVITFHAPKFDAAGAKVSNARIDSILLNDKLIQKDVELKGVTPGGLTGKEHPTGPLMFQGNHGAVAYRNIVVTPLK